MMAQDDPAAGIKNWEEKFWSLDGLLDKGSKRPASKSDNSYLDEETRKANESFREADEKRRGTALKGTSSSVTKRRSKRKQAGKTARRK